jgi:hypothetical protein
MEFLNKGKPSLKRKCKEKFYRRQCRKRRRKSATVEMAMLPKPRGSVPWSVNLPVGGVP